MPVEAPYICVLPYWTSLRIKFLLLQENVLNEYIVYNPLSCMYGSLNSYTNHSSITQESQIKRIFGTMISQKLQDFDEDVKPLADVMTQATIEIYNFISTKMLPTPTKIHYLFNLRDISKVINTYCIPYHLYVSAL